MSNERERLEKYLKWFPETDNNALESDEYIMEAKDEIRLLFDEQARGNERLKKIEELSDQYFMVIVNKRKELADLRAEVAEVKEIRDWTP